MIKKIKISFIAKIISIALLIAAFGLIIYNSIRFINLIDKPELIWLAVGFLLLVIVPIITLLFVWIAEKSTNDQWLRLYRSTLHVSIYWIIASILGLVLPFVFIDGLGLNAIGMGPLAILPQIVGLVLSLGLYLALRRYRYDKISIFGLAFMCAATLLMATTVYHYL